jgi:pimeloyl-ACP methyl ester carboxylesterase
MSDGSAGTVVLVHGGFVDGSGWQGVYQQLTKDGYSVSVVQNPTLSLAGDVEATRRVIDAQTEPVILVGHSYGGAVITEAGTDPNVKALVYRLDAPRGVQQGAARVPGKGHGRLRPHGSRPGRRNQEQRLAESRSTTAELAQTEPARLGFPPAGRAPRARRTRVP